MTVLSATEARSKFYRLIDQTSLSHEPILITGKRGNAVLISEDDWRSIQETMFSFKYPRNARVNQRRFRSSNRRM